MTSIRRHLFEGKSFKREPDLITKQNNYRRKGVLDYHMEKFLYEFKGLKLTKYYSPQIIVKKEWLGVTK